VDDPTRDLAGALHEVGNALTVVIGWLDRVRAADLEPEVRRALDVAHARALDGRAIARGAIGAAVEPLHREQPLGELVAEAMTGVLPEASAKSIKLEPTVFSPEALVDDPRTALQILTNLLMNAIAFSPRGSVVRAEATADGGEVVVRVRDEGPGILPERRDQLFLRGRTTRDGGAGVGLLHARSLARRIGGDVALEPSTGGACFALRWPRAAARSTRAPRAPERASLAGQRVLVVEDDAAVLILLETALGTRGAQVVCARTSAELHAALKGPAFHAALVDLSPLGNSVADHLAAVRATSPEARVIVVSGNACPADEALAAANAWVRKPFDLGEVLAALAASSGVVRTG
jgi:CheY-like chemotaxis protein/two-component sensor histidine kinase